MAAAIHNTLTETSSRRTLLTGTAILAATTPAIAAAAAPSGIGAPAAASPEITSAAAAYWARVAECNTPGIEDEAIEPKCREISEAAARLAALPCRSVADMAAKLAFFLAVANEAGALQYVTAPEGNVLLSVEAHLRALVGGAA